MRKRPPGSGCTWSSSHGRAKVHGLDSLRDLIVEGCVQLRAIAKTFFEFIKPVQSRVIRCTQSWCAHVR
jgi:hypothetical protein